MHIFHNWSMWMQEKIEYIEESQKYYDEFYEEMRTRTRRFYRIHERRRCAECGKVEFRIRECS